jgi:hypothetical protein
MVGPLGVREDGSSEEQKKVCCWRHSARGGKSSKAGAVSGQATWKKRGVLSEGKRCLVSRGVGDSVGGCAVACSREGLAAQRKVKSRGLGGQLFVWYAGAQACLACSQRSSAAYSQWYWAAPLSVATSKPHLPAKSTRICRGGGGDGAQTPAGAGAPSAQRTSGKHRSPGSPPPEKSPPPPPWARAAPQTGSGAWAGAGRAGSTACPPRHPRRRQRRLGRARW